MKKTVLVMLALAGAVLAAQPPALTPDHPWWDQPPFEEDPGSDEGWARFTRASWRRDFPGFVEFFFREMFQEAHSEKQVEDCVGWGLDIGEAALEHTMDAPPSYATRAEAEALVAGVRCPVLVIHGDLDRVGPGHQEQLGQHEHAGPGGLAVDADQDR